MAGGPIARLGETAEPALQPGADFGEAIVALAQTKTGYRGVAEIDGTPTVCEVTGAPEMVQIEARTQQSSAVVRWAKQGGEWTREPGGDRHHEYWC